MGNYNRFINLNPEKMLGGAIKSNPKILSKLALEFDRYKVVKEILALSRNNRYHAAIEKFLILMASDPMPIRHGNLDPVFIQIPIDHKYYRYIDELTKYGLSPDELVRLKNKIKSLIDNFIDLKSHPIPEYEFTPISGISSANVIFKCSGFRKKIPDRMYNALRYRAELETKESPENINLLILIVILRYECIVSRLQQWNTPLDFCRRLYEMGYRIEAMSSPLNSQFLVCDAETGSSFGSGSDIRSEKSDLASASVYYSLFPDTDCYFGSLGNFRNFNPEQLKKYKNPGMLIVPPGMQESTLIIAETIPRLVKSGCNFVYLSPYGDSVMSNSVRRIELQSREYYIENCVLFDVPIKYYVGYKYYAFIKGDYPRDLFSSMRYQLTEDIKRVKYIRMLKREYLRYKTTMKIANYFPDHYEWMNILERILLNMANLDRTPDQDQIMLDLPESHWIYEKARNEMYEKNIPTSGAIDRIRSDISEYLAEADKINKADSPDYSSNLLDSNKLQYYFDASGFHCNEYNKNFGDEKTYMLIEKLGGTGEQDYFIEIMLILFLRYESVLMRGQHWNVPYTWYEFIHRHYNVAFESFASPINSQLLLVDWFSPDRKDIIFCSLFKDTDHYFGSKGSIFQFDLEAYMRESGRKELGISMALPYVPQIIVDAANLADRWLALPFRIRIFVGAPYWPDADWYEHFLKSNYKQSHKILKYKEFYYENNLEETVPRIYHRTPFTEFVLANFKQPSTEPNYEKAYQSLKHVKY